MIVSLENVPKNVMRGYVMIVSLQIFPKHLEKLRQKEIPKMRISTKPFYKLFSVVHNYFSMNVSKSLIGYMMIVSLQNVSKNLENLRENGKPENANIY